MDKRIITLLAMFGIAFLLMNVQVTEQQKEIPCKGFDDCMEIAKRYGIDKTAVICETEKGIKKCKVIVTSG